MNKVLLIIGCHKDALVDVANFGTLYPQECDFLAVGLDAVKLPFPWIYVATYHKEDIIKIRQHLDSLGIEAKVIHHMRGVEIDIVEPYAPPSGSSALLGTLAAIKMGYKKIVLCGCPLDGENNKRTSYSIFHKGWQVHLEVKPFVRSMSGFTAEVLGSPTKEWLTNDQ